MLHEAWSHSEPRALQAKLRKRCKSTESGCGWICLIGSIFKLQSWRFNRWSHGFRWKWLCYVKDWTAWTPSVLAAICLLSLKSSYRSHSKCYLGNRFLQLFSTFGTKFKFRIWAWSSASLCDPNPDWFVNFFPLWNDTHRGDWFCFSALPLLPDSSFISSVVSRLNPTSVNLLCAKDESSILISHQQRWKDTKGGPAVLSSKQKRHFISSNSDSK